MVSEPLAALAELRQRASAGDIWCADLARHISSVEQANRVTLCNLKATEAMVTNIREVLGNQDIPQAIEALLAKVRDTEQANPDIAREVERRKAEQAVLDEIKAIMATYREQEKRGYVDTPGGLEHMGDVWRLLGKWDEALRQLEETNG